MEHELTVREEPREMGVGIAGAVGAAAATLADGVRAGCPQARCRRAEGCAWSFS